MIVVKVSDKVEYRIDKLQKGIKVSKEVPKFIITGREEGEED